MGYRFMMRWSPGLMFLAVIKRFYLRRMLGTVLPVDGFVFWLNAALLSPAQLAAAQLVSAAPIPVSVTSMHYASQGSMEYDESIVIRRVDFTSEVEIDAFSEMSSGVLYVGNWDTPWGSFRFSFSARNSYYRQADLHHYVGDAIYPVFEAQLIDSVAGFDQRQVVSNSLPLWLTMMTAPPYPSPITPPAVPLYPAFLVPDNLPPPYGVIDIAPTGTRALQPVPYRSGNSSSYQLVSDRVTLIFYGLRNDEVWDLRDYAFDYSANTGMFGIMNDPVIRDERRFQLELNALAQKKTLEFEVSYYQGRMRDLARQYILGAIAVVSGNNTLPPIPPDNFKPFPPPIPPPTIVRIGDYATINTTAPLTGGGDLSADRTLSINNCTATASGAVPTPPNNTTTFLRGDCTFAAPSTAPAAPVIYTGSSPVTLAAIDGLYEAIEMATPATLTINLPASPTAGLRLCIKDGLKNFASFNATIKTTDSATIDKVSRLDRLRHEPERPVELLQICRERYELVCDVGGLRRL
jgi:hypothetical protein